MLSSSAIIFGWLALMTDSLRHVSPRVPWHDTVCPYFSMSLLSFNDLARIMTQVLGKPTQEVRGPVSSHRSCGKALVMLSPKAVGMFADVGQGIYVAESRTPETTTPTTFRQWCEEVLWPAVGCLS
jgi:hypothetical protein